MFLACLEKNDPLPSAEYCFISLEGIRGKMSSKDEDIRGSWPNNEEGDWVTDPRLGKRLIVRRDERFCRDSGTVEKTGRERNGGGYTSRSRGQ